MNKVCIFTLTGIYFTFLIRPPVKTINKMKKIKYFLIAAILTSGLFFTFRNAESQEVIKITTPMVPPEWALLERQVLQSSSIAISEFCNHFCDKNGTYLHVARWGALDGTDDVIEFSKLWTILYALGASENVMDEYHKTMEAAFLQYAAVKTTQTDVAKY